MTVFPARVMTFLLRRFADRFGIEPRTDGVNLGLDHFAAQIIADPSCFSLFPPDSRLPDVPGLRSIPLVEPVPLYAWSLVLPGRLGGL